MTTTKPTPFSSGALVYYPTVSKTVLLDFGNYPATMTNQCQTWLYASGNWSLALSTPATNPTARTEGQMAYDGTNLVLFGGRGSAGTNLLGDTNLYVNGVWSVNNAGTGAASGVTYPGPRQGHSMTSMTGPNSVLMFGGKNTSGLLLDTFVWTASGGSGSWVQTTVANGAGPSARADAALANNGANAVLFGGSGLNGDLNDLWLYSNTSSTWTKLTTNAGPSIRHGASFIFDTNDNYYLLFGGADQYNVLGDSWSLTISGTVGTWTKLSPTGSPPNLAYAGMVYHTAENRVLLVGGEDQWGNLNNNSYVFSGGNFSAI